MSPIRDLAATLAERRAGEGVQTYVVGVTGGVAAGKSTIARQLADAFVALTPTLVADVVGSDGFLFTNQALAEADLTLRKGFPETYDRAALAQTLQTVRSGRAVFPGYSHTLYDIDPTLARALDRPPVLIVEGLGLGGAPLDALVYVDADEAALEAWYTTRFMGLWEAGRADPTSFYAQFSSLNPDQARRFAGQVWRQINLPNVREHVLPLRDIAEVVIRKNPDHGIETVTVRGQG